MWTLERLLSLADDREQAMGISPVRLHGAHEHRARVPAMATRRSFGSGTPTAAIALKTRLQRPLRLARPARRDAARGGGGGAQRSVHGRAADGDHELPQFRKSEATRGLLPVHRGRARHGRGMRRARHAGHWRQRLASTTRIRAAPCIPRRWSGWSASSTRWRTSRAPASRPRVTPSSSSASPPMSWAAANISRAFTMWWPALRPAAISRVEKATIDALLEAIRAGVVRSAHDCSDGGLAVAMAECCIADRGRNDRRGNRVELRGACCPCARCCSARRRRESIVSTPESATRARSRPQARRPGARHRCGARPRRRAHDRDRRARAARSARATCARLSRRDSAHHECIHRASSR